MYHLIFVASIWSVFAYMFIDFKRIKAYYPTLLFFIDINLLYNFLYYNHTLWAYKTKTESFLNHTIIASIYIMVLIPITIIIYLQIFPEAKSYKKKISYISVWATFFTVLEHLFLINDMFVHANGWGITKSFLFNIVMFTLFYIHYKKPLRAVVLTGIIVFAFIIMFPIPLSIMK